MSDPEIPNKNGPKPTERNEDGTFAEGNPGGPGRPKGSISVITRLKQIFEENPEEFEDFVNEYRKDPANRRHITEMIDGKPQQDITTKGEKLPTPIYGGISAIQEHDSNSEDLSAQEED